MFVGFPVLRGRVPMATLGYMRWFITNSTVIPVFFMFSFLNANKSLWIDTELISRSKQQTSKNCYVSVCFCAYACWDGCAGVHVPVPILGVNAVDFPNTIVIPVPLMFSSLDESKFKLYSHHP